MIEIFDTLDKDDRSTAERSAAMTTMLKQTASIEHQAAMATAESAEQRRADADVKLARRKELIEKALATGSAKNLEDAEVALSNAETALKKTEQDIESLRGDYFGDVEQPASEEPQATKSSTAPVVAVGASGGVETDKAAQAQNTVTGPKFSMTLRAMIEQHKHDWPTIEVDIKGASDNGLDAAKAGPRGWWELEAMEWARSKGKLLSAVKPAAELAQTMNSMASLPGRKYTKGY